jgi:hypothetical protein
VTPDAVTPCEFCGADSSIALFGHRVCKRCNALYFAIGEAMLADAPMLCEVCGAVASEIVDSHMLCDKHHLPVSVVVEDGVRTLGMAGTADEIRDLPETDLPETEA